MWVNEDGVMVGKWKDKRDVFMIATNDAGGDVIRPICRHRQRINLPVLTCVGRYNAHMGDVDHLDQMRSY